MLSGLPIPSHTTLASMNCKKVRVPLVVWNCSTIVVAAMVTIKNISLRLEHGTNISD